MTKETRQRLVYIVLDYLPTNVAWLLFNIIRFATIAGRQHQFPTLETYLEDPQVILGQIIVPIVAMAVYYLSGYYNTPFLKSRLQEIVVSIASAAVLTIGIYFAMLINDVTDDRLFSYRLLLVLFGLLFLVVYIPRIIVTQINHVKIKHRTLTFDTLVVGTSYSAIEFGKRLMNMRRSMGFNIVGYVEADEGRRSPELDKPVYALEDLDSVCKEHNIKNLIIIPHRHGIKATIDLINRLFPLDLPMFISPDLYHLMTSGARISNVAGEPLIDISRTDMSQSTVNIKRFCDIVISAVTLVIISPILLAVAIAVKSTSKGKIIYTQERIGYHKKPFKIYKFRSMYSNAEEDGPLLSSPNDPRVTKVGRFIRKYRFDELPQFWNVLKGDMSLVGPRPERDIYIQQIVARAPYYSLIHQVRPGITSWGMVKYGYASDVNGMIERLRYDILYIENVSFSVDMKIIFYTIRTIITGQGI
ncbi:MAG: sugar transferase [Muribaculaceae bacterium]|nr:sugar transferase [Muribaculaceae bacterium]